MVGPWKEIETGVIGNMTLKCLPHPFFLILSTLLNTGYKFRRKIFLSSENGAVVSCFQKKKKIS